MRALVVHAHPLEESLVAAARDRVMAGLRGAGHHVDLIDLHAEGFAAALSAEEWRGHADGLAGRRADVLPHAELLRRAEALVLVYPTWWGGQPAILKGWLDRVWVEGVAYTLPQGTDRVRPLLRRVRRLAAVTTHGSPKWINALEGEPGKRVVLRQLRALCHPLVRTRWLALYGVDAIDAARCRGFLDKVERTVSRW